MPCPPLPPCVSPPPAHSQPAAEVAKKGGSTPERFGCCHGVKQATRAASSWALGRIGRLALRESAMAIEVALDIAPGNQTMDSAMGWIRSLGSLRPGYEIAPAD